MFKPRDYGNKFITTIQDWSPKKLLHGDNTCGKDFVYSKVNNDNIEKILMERILVSNKSIQEKVKYISVILTEIINCNYFVYNDWLELFQKYLPENNDYGEVCEYIFKHVKQIDVWVI